MLTEVFTKEEMQRIRDEFPIFNREINGRPLVYLDNGATSQKPLSVLDVSRHYYEEYNANIHRGVHRLAQEATVAYERARDKVASHFHCQREEVIFTSGTTDGINLVAGILERADYFQKGDEILVSVLEHHSNIVPWQMLAEATGAVIKVMPLTDEGVWDVEAGLALMSVNTKLVALNQVSNALGTVNPVAPFIALAKSVGAYCLIDAAQSAPHFSIDFEELDVDFLAFSGHKMYAPTGVGALLGRREVMEKLPPYRGGGEMIKEVSFEGTTYNDLPGKYEAGTPNIEGVIALGSAIDFMNEIGVAKIAQHEAYLTQYLEAELAKIDGIHIYSKEANKAGAVSFALENTHHYDLGTLLDQFGVAVRTGHHCCQPLMSSLGITGTVRASLAVYNTKEDIMRLIEALIKAKMMLS